MKLSEFLNLNESINDKGILKACFFAGGPGSGKSYTLKQIKGGTIPTRIVNTDKFVEFQTGGVLGDWDKIGDKAKLLTKKQLLLYLNSLLPLFIDGTSSSPNGLFRRRGILQAIGYDIALVFVDVDLETAIERNKKRKRVVDIEFLKRTHEKLQKLKEYYKTEFNNYYYVDTSGDLDDKTILEAYRKVSGFFNSSLKNPIGIKLRDDMIEMGQKYLIDNEKYDMMYINKLIDSWYKD